MCLLAKARLRRPDQVSLFICHLLVPPMSSVSDSDKSEISKVICDLSHNIACLTMVHKTFRPFVFTVVVARRSVTFPTVYAFWISCDIYHVFTVTLLLIQLQK